MNTLVRIVSLRFPPDLCDKLDQLSKADGRTRHAYIMRALRQHVDRAMGNLEHVVAPAQNRGVVHHIDGDPENNDLANLVVFPK